MSENQETSSLSGQLKFIVFKNEDNGFFIGKLKTEQDEESHGKTEVTIAGQAVGGIPEIKSDLKLDGSWTTHPKFGEQFKFSLIREDFEVSVKGQEKFLVNYVKGLGPVKAKDLITQFGTNIFELIRNDERELILPHGVSEELFELMKEALEAHGQDGEAIAVLTSYEITPNSIQKLLETYRSANKAVQIIQDNPYQLITDLAGFGFLKADKIALQIGIDLNSPARIGAAVIHVLNEIASRGHTYAFRQKLIWGAGKYEKGMIDYLGASVTEDEIDQNLIKLYKENKIHLGFDSGNDSLVDSYLEVLEGANITFNTTLKISLSYLYQAEREIERTTVDLLNKKEEPKEAPLSETLNIDQTAAISRIFDGQSGICVITGGAGVGKTFVTQEILRLAKIHKLTCQLLSPTGKAAKRLEEMTGRSASTIHRYLEYNPYEGGFTLDYISHDVLIIDEASMVDSYLMSELLRRLNPNKTKLILVGDKNQLPPVGAGRPFQDIIESNFFPVFTLQKIMRTDDDSLIPINAGKILDGEYNSIEFDDKQMGMINEKTAEDIPQLIVREILDDPNFSPKEIQVLTPQKKGPIGTGELNSALRVAINRTGKELTKFKEFSTGDKVILVHNNYEAGYMNGDQGYVLGEDLSNSKRPTMNIQLDDESVISVDRSTIYDVQLGYAITIHKSQGSEWPRIIMPVHLAHSFMLSRNLIYTGITRGRYNVTLMGTQFGLKTACEKSGVGERLTWLSDFFQEYKGGENFEKEISE